MSKYTDPASRTAEQWRAAAQAHDRSAQQSWERSDTDGFLSQWASQSMAHFHRDLATVAANGNRAQIAWLFDAQTAEPVEHWRWVQGRYGSSVAIGERPDTVWFRPSQARNGAVREANDRAKGYVWGTVETEVVLYQFGSTVLQTGYERKRGAPLAVLGIGDYRD